MSPTAGQLVTETFEYDGGRQVTVYVPPASPESIVFAGDGGWHIPRLAEVLEAAHVRSTMIVGVHGLGSRSTTRPRLSTPSPSSSRPGARWASAGRKPRPPAAGNDQPLTFLRVPRDQ